MRIRSLYSDDFAPFGEMDLRFPEVENPTRGAEVHVLAGVNGTGKTRVLCALAAGLGEPNPLLWRVGPDSISFVASTDGTTTEPLRSRGVPAFDEIQSRYPNRPIFDFGPEAGKFRAGALAAVAKNMPCYAYGGEAHLAECAITAMAPVAVPEKNVALSFSKPAKSSKDLAQALSNLTLAGSQHIKNFGGLEAARTKSRQLRLITHLEECLSKLADRPVTFEVVSSPQTALTVNWGNKPLFFQVLPDGLRSILGWLAELAVLMDLHYPNEEKPWEQPLIVLLDEVERHLHPGWQRQVLPMAQAMFPGAQFFVATHSPFMIASLNEGWIHNFTMGADGKVNIEPPIPASEGDSYVSVVSSIMGMTELYDPETEGLLADYRDWRSKALRKEEGAFEKALERAGKIGQRSVELGYMMAKEEAQLRKLVNGSAAK